MAKELIQSYYTFDASEDTITVPGFVKQEELFLITDVTNNVIIYNFADSARGVDTVTYDSNNEETTIVLSANTVDLGCTDTDKLQIIVDRVNQKMDVADSLLDPVHKIRVSTPQNLIDTDFEYGLQPTKWETLELSQNVPSFYVADGDAAIATVSTVTAVNGSDLITVTCTDQHGLVVGTPIDAQGLTSRTAEGKYLVKSTTDTTFTYQAAAAQSVTGEIGSVYTAITPGQFYTGSQISYNKTTGFVSDEAAESDLTITTPDPHGFVQDSNFYLTNTVAKKRLILSDTTSSNAPDGRPYVDPDNTVTVTPTLDLTKTETKAMVPMHSHKFDASAVSTAANTIEWPSHGLRTNDSIIYVPSSGDTAIGGLSRFEFYYVIVVDSDNISLTTSESGSAISLTSTGTYSYGRALIGVAYEIVYLDDIGSYNYLWTPHYRYGGNRGGLDLETNFTSGGFTAAGYGAAGSYQSAGGFALFVSRSGTLVEGYRTVARYPRGYSTALNSQMTIPETTNTPGNYNFIEDGNYFNTGFNRSNFYAGYVDTSFAGRIRTYHASGNFDQSIGRRNIYWLPLKPDPERDTLFAEAHGMESGSSVTISTTAGDAIKTTTGGDAVLGTRSTLANGTYTVEKVSNDRFRILNGSTTQRIYQATGTYSLSGTATNTLKNSFYLPAHALADKTDLTFALDGGTAPTTTSGRVIQDPGITNIPSWKVIDNSLSDYFDALSGHVDITTNSLAGGSRITGASDTPLTYTSFTYGNSTFYREWINGSRQQTVYAQILADKINSSTLYKPWENTVYNGKDIGVMGTDWAQNTTIPYWACVFQTDSSWTYDEIRPLLYGYWNGTGATRSEGRYYHQSYTSGGHDWYWSGSWIRVASNSTPNDALMVNIKIRNRSDYNSITGMYSYSYDNRSDYGYIYTDDNQANGDLNIFLVFAVDDATTWGNSEIIALARHLIDDLATNLVYPTLTNGDTVTARVKNNDRISLESSTSGFEIDLTNNGAANLQFTTADGQIGVIDGAYTASQTTDTSITLPTQFTVLPVDFTFDASTIADDMIIVTDGHNFQPAQRITYNNGGNSSVGGLTSGTDYYVIIVDDVYIQLAADEADAISGQSIALTAGTGTHNLENSAVSGITEATGTVTVTADSDKLVGNETLFKRYFKPGDSIYLKDDNNTPGALNEYTVIAVSDDSTMQVDRLVGFASTTSKYFVESSIYARPDGYAVHRPFDGGVEIAAGTAPYSQISRQTRKYFRYQSGKGIQTSLAINFSPPVVADTLTASGNTATVTTKYPHRLSNTLNVTISGASDDEYNISAEVTTVDDFTFTYDMPNVPNISTPGGIIQYVVDSYSGAATRSGMFDLQNGFFFEYDGGTLYAVRRTSTLQLSGTCTVTQNSNKITGSSTNFSSQLNVGDYIVLRGMSYRVTRINSNSEMFVQPEYRGVSTSNIIITKTEDIKVPQSEWNIDKADGTGPEGFNLNIHKIQMAYMDYSWYGAGKIRFGFKDTKGHVRYCHEFIHNNRLDESYMRSGNMPAKYEVINGANPTYAPTLFHWGTSVIMDGTFDEDEAYLFTAQSKALNFTNGQAVTATTSSSGSLVRQWNRQQRYYDYYLEIPFSDSDASLFSTGTPLYTTDGELNGQEVAYTRFSGSNVFVAIYLQSGYSYPAVYPSVANATTVNIGEPASGGDAINLGTALIPLVTLRLAPSVDGGISGNLGERDIINRMQLKLQEVGLIVTHDVEVKLILNGDLSSILWEKVNSPSLSQLLKHESGDEVIGGSEIFSFRASGGSTDSNGKRLSAATNFSLASVIDMGNSILGGDGIFPNGPDILTVAVQVVDTADISATSAFNASARITWSESQA